MRILPTLLHFLGPLVPLAAEAEVDEEDGQEEGNHPPAGGEVKIHFDYRFSLLSVESKLCFYCTDKELTTFTLANIFFGGLDLATR